MLGMTVQGGWIGHAEYRLMLNELALPTEGRILDVGCGTGWFARQLATLLGLQVAGIDLDADSLALGRIGRTLFILDWLQSIELRRRVQARLKIGEARNALARAVFFNRLGEMSERPRLPRPPRIQI
jgi:SAM-dependent methyltransferase